MRILHVLDHSAPLHSGYTFRTLSILDAQRALGWETAHLTGPKQGVDVDEEDVDGRHFYRTRPIPRRTASWPLLGHWQLVRALTARLIVVAERVKPDIIHAHSPALNGLAALRAAKRLRLPVVYEVRAFWEDAAVDHGTSRENGPRYQLTRALETHVLRRADHVTTICDGLRRDIIARGIPAANVTVIPNAVHPDRFAFDRPRDTALAAELGLSGQTVLGFVGSFYAYEGLDLLLDALALLQQPAHSDIRLLLVGGGPQEDALKAQARALDLGGRVQFVGRVPHDQVGRYYSVIDWLVYPRRANRLTELVTPLKPLEAMALGKPVLASDVGGHRELIVDGDNGLLFPAGSAEQLAARLEAVLASGKEPHAIKERGRLFVEEHRTWAASVARYDNIYGALLEPAAARRSSASPTESHRLEQPRS